MLNASSGPMIERKTSDRQDSEDESFDLILDKLRRNKGVDFSLYRPGTIRRRILSRIKATGCGDFADYILYLNREPLEYDRAIEAVTINVTEFFRDPEIFTCLSEDIFPEMIRSKDARGRRIVRIWSAGTSNGEEAYTLAILFLEILGERASDFHLKIYGTDIDPDCLEKAKAGVYSPSSLKHVPPRFLVKYFEKKGENYTVTPRLKALTRFQRHDLVADNVLTHMDVILCRNVVIYFTRPLQDFVYANFAKALNKGGFLILGKVESLWGYPVSYFDTINLTGRIYRRSEKQGGRADV